MKLKRVVAFTFVFALALAAVFLPVAGSAGQMQTHCKSFHVLVQMILPTPNQFESTDTWGGTIFGNLDTEFMQGGLSGNDGTEYPHGPFSIFKNGLYKMCLTSAATWGGASDCLDSVTYKAQAVVVWPAGESLGTYTAKANVVKGTHRFASATGHLDLSGPFIAWPDANSPFGASGRANVDFNGKICGVQ